MITRRGVGGTCGSPSPRWVARRRAGLGQATAWGRASATRIFTACRQRFCRSAPVKLLVWHGAPRHPPSQAVGFDAGLIAGRPRGLSSVDSPLAGWAFGSTPHRGRRIRALPRPRESACAYSSNRRCLAPTVEIAPRRSTISSRVCSARTSQSRMAKSVGLTPKHRKIRSSGGRP